MFEEEIVPQRYANNPMWNAFINDLVCALRLRFRRLAMTCFNRVSYSATAVKLVLPRLTPASKKLARLSGTFCGAIRIAAGVKFWRANQAALQRASDQYGVPPPPPAPEAIVGIIGVETIYGKYMGNFRARRCTDHAHALIIPTRRTRAERQATFRKNLEDLLVWTHDQQIDPTTVLGSYTGAIGIPQFLPSSIVQYAVDYDGNGHIDFADSARRCHRQCANYLKQHGWESGRPVVWKIAGDTGSQGIAQAAADGQPEPHWSARAAHESRHADERTGAQHRSGSGHAGDGRRLAHTGRSTEYTLGLKNFYVLTRYNRSFFYATHCVISLRSRESADVNGKCWGFSIAMT